MLGTVRKSSKLWLGLLLLATTCGSAAAFGPNLLWGDGVDYSKVRSIRSDPSFQSAALLEKAWALPVAALYAKGRVDFQHNGSFCGPTSLVNVLRSQGEAATQGKILEGTETRTVLGFLPGGIALDALAELARVKVSPDVKVLRGLTLSTFRAHMLDANDPNKRYVVNFHRGPLFGKGGGHHSPIGGYLASADRVLVIDVNDSYKPWLVSPARLFEAVDTVDPATHQKRGLLLIEN